jgi:hypothetical protein
MVIDTEFSEGHQCEKWVLTKETIAKMIEARWQRESNGESATYK